MSTKYTKWHYNRPNDNKMYQHLKFQCPPKCTQNWVLWLENMPSVNRDTCVKTCLRESSILVVFGEKAFPIVLNGYGAVAIAGAVYGKVKLNWVFTRYNVSSLNAHSQNVVSQNNISPKTLSTAFPQITDVWSNDVFPKRRLVKQCFPIQPYFC
jgi:hypothetical protein